MSFFYQLAQMAGAGGLVNLLLGVSGELAQDLVIAVVGVLMNLFVLPTLYLRFGKRTGPPPTPKPPDRVQVPETAGVAS